MTFLIIIFILCVIVFIYTIFHDKLNYLQINLNNIEEKINSTLIKRKELLKDSEDSIKELVKTEKKVYQDLDKLNNEKLNMIMLDRKLLSYMNEFHLIFDKYEVLQEDEEFQKLAFAINETEDLLNAYKTYYNNYAEKYNKFIKSFPIGIISLFKRRKKKEFFDAKDINDNDYQNFKY